MVARQHALSAPSSRSRDQSSVRSSRALLHRAAARVYAEVRGRWIGQPQAWIDPPRGSSFHRPAPTSFFRKHSATHGSSLRSPQKFPTQMPGCPKCVNVCKAQLRRTKFAESAPSFRTLFEHLALQRARAITTGRSGIATRGSRLLCSTRPRVVAHCSCLVDRTQSRKPREEAATTGFLVVLP